MFDREGTYFFSLFLIPYIHIIPKFLIKINLSPRDEPYTVKNGGNLHRKACETDTNCSASCNSLCDKLRNALNQYHFRRSS